MPGQRGFTTTASRKLISGVITAENFLIRTGKKLKEQNLMINFLFVATVVVIAGKKKMHGNT